MADFDASGVAATVRTLTAEQMRDHYGRVFAGPIGQTVLLDILVKGGVAAKRGDEVGAERRAYHDGRADLALQILEMTSVDPIGAAAVVMTADTKGSDDERPEPEF